MNCLVQPKWHPLHSYALALQIPLMDKLLDSGVDINLLDRVSYVLMISIFLSYYLGNTIWEGRGNYASVADTGWLHLSSQGGHRKKGGCH